MKVPAHLLVTAGGLDRSDAFCMQFNALLAHPIKFRRPPDAIGTNVSGKVFAAVASSAPALCARRRSV